MPAQQPKKSDRSKQIISNPSYTRSLTLQTQQAQRVMRRSFEQVDKALFSVDVILRIIGEHKDVDEVRSVVNELFDKHAVDLDAESARFEKLIEQNGIPEMPGYDHPAALKVAITSPQLQRFVNLVVALDRMIVMIDCLWLSGKLEGKQRSEATFAWQQRILRLARQIIHMKSRAMAAARRQNKGDEAQQALEAEGLGSSEELEVDVGEELAGGEEAGEDVAAEKPAGKRARKTTKAGAAEEAGVAAP